MRLSSKTRFLVLCFFSFFTFFSCKTQNPSIKEPVAEQGKKQAYSRLAFGESLQKLLSDGKNDEALTLFDTIPEKEKATLSIQLLKLSIMLSSGKQAEATALATSLEALYPQNTEILYIQAILAGSRNDNTGRTKYLNKVLEFEPTHTQALTALAMDLFARKNYPLAKSTLIKAIASDPDNTEALLALARVYYMQSDLSKSSDTLNLAIEKAPEYSVLWSERARVKSETNNLGGAIEDIQKAVELDPSIYSHWIDYGNYLISTAKKEEARKAFTNAIAIKPNDYLAYIYRAGLNDDLGNLDEAIYDYSAICTLYPQYYYASESLGILLWGKGDYEGSRSAFQTALMYNPKNTSYALMLTLCYYREKKDIEAKTFMAKYITTLDRDSTEYFLCRMFADRSGDADVLNRILKEKETNTRNRMLFYSAMYYELFQSKAIAQKYYIEVVSIPSPNFFEYRLSQWALKNMKPDGQTVQG